MARAASHWRTGGVRPDATHAVAPLRHARSRHAAGPPLGDSLRSARRDSLMDLEYRRALALSWISETWTARAVVEDESGATAGANMFRGSRSDNRWFSPCGNFHEAVS